MSVFGLRLAGVRTVGNRKRLIGLGWTPQSRFWLDLHADEPGLHSGVPCDRSEWPPRQQHRMGDLLAFLAPPVDDRPCLIYRLSTGETAVQVLAGSIQEAA